MNIEFWNMRLIPKFLMIELNLTKLILLQVKFGNDILRFPNTYCLDLHPYLFIETISPSESQHGQLLIAVDTGFYSLGF